jgi:hypothetical protein
MNIWLTITQIQNNIFPELIRFWDIIKKIYFYESSSLIMDDLFLIKYIEVLCVSINSNSKISLNISISF